MTGKEKIIKTAKKKKVFRASDVKDLPSTHTHRYLARLVKDGRIERVGYGIYSLVESEFTEMQTFLEVATRVPNGVLCLLSALQFHNLTTQNPFEVWFAIPRDTHIPRFQLVQTRIFRFTSRIYAEGIETHTVEGVEIKVYSAAKTVVDCFYFRREVGLDVAIEALRDAWRKRLATMDELYYFAGIRNIRSVILPYLNTLG